MNPLDHAKAKLEDALIEANTNVHREVAIDIDVVCTPHGDVQAILPPDGTSLDVAEAYTLYAELNRVKTAKAVVDFWLEERDRPH